jgi:ATP-dependent DNA helicase RecQ
MDALAVQLEEHLARFKLTSFRPGQREVIEAVLAGHDCLCIMPTGGGKSLCYQLPAVAREGVTLVVSPLIALMKDQVDALHDLGIAATFINSSLAPREQFDRMDAMAAGQFDLVYIAPERLRSSIFIEKLRATRLQLLAVDEAHCISEWGHDFRPDYARLGLVRQRLGFPPTIALTATATPQVRADVARQLQLREPKIFITGFARTNLHFEVHQAYSDFDKDQTLIDFLAETPGAGIVYCSTRKRCEELVETLRTRTKGRKIGLYHAGLAQDDRRRVQDDFMSGRVPIIVATNAFGMGIDKADLRFVVHYNMPGSVEAYYQEAGRAGRDGLPSRCLLIYTPNDRSTQEYFIDSSYPEPDVVQEVYDYLRAIDAEPIELTLDEIKQELGLNIRSEGISACEKLLEGVGALERLDSRQNMAGVKIDSDLPTLVDLLPREARVQRKVLQVVERLVGELRFERIFVSPRQVAKEAELDLEATNRALRELSKLQAFDYVPPFRGRAVHMLERRKQFDKLGIDFLEQERRKAAEYAKLDRMEHYAKSRRCRQLEILDYFGDPAKKKCGLCDQCGGIRPIAAAHAPATEDPNPPQVVQAVRMVLAGVARMCQRGQYGKRLLAGMLIGSTSAKITKLGLNRLSTYGLLKQLTEDEAVALIDLLLQRRLLSQFEVDRFKPVVELTPRGEQVMKGQLPLAELLPLGEEVTLKLCGVSVTPQPVKSAKPDRQATAQHAAAKPPRDPHFDPFSDVNAEWDEPIVEPAPPKTAAKAARPSTDKRPRATPTTSAAPVATARAPKQPGKESPAGTAPASAALASAVPSPVNNVTAQHYWTWRVMNAGFSAAECREIRRLDEDTFADHLLRAARDGRPIDVAWVLTRQQIATLAEAVGDGSPERLKAVLARLPAGIKYRDVQVYLLSRGLTPM